jgi:hypothetical protein
LTQIMAKPPRGARICISAKTTRRTAAVRKKRAFIVGSRERIISDPLRPFPVGPGTGGERHKPPFNSDALVLAKRLSPVDPARDQSRQTRRAQLEDVDS